MTDERGVPPTPKPVENPPLALIDGHPVPWDEFEEIYALKVQKYLDEGEKVPETMDRRYRITIAKRVVDHRLVRAAAQRAGVELDPDALAALPGGPTSPRSRGNDPRPTIGRRVGTSASWPMTTRCPSCSASP